MISQLIWFNFNLVLFILFQARQESSRSYEEVCGPVLQRCQFLFTEMRPAVSSEFNTVTRIRIQNTVPRWKKIVQQMIRSKNWDKAKQKFAEGKNNSDSERESVHTEEKLLSSDSVPEDHLKVTERKVITDSVGTVYYFVPLNICYFNWPSIMFRA